MERSFKLTALTAIVMSTVAMTSCVDDAYDLENINTDVQVNVNDLVVPVNLDAITLSNAFDLDEGSVIKELDDRYVVVVDGKFSSSRIHVSPVSVTPGQIAPINCQIFKYEGSDVSLPIAQQSISYEITPATTPFTFQSATVDKTIRDITRIRGNWNINLSLNLEDRNRLFETLAFQRLVLELPAGLHVSNYPCNNGLVTIGDLQMAIGSDTHVTLTIDEIDFTRFDAGTFSFTAATGDRNDGKIDFNGTIGVKSGLVVGSTSKSDTSFPQDVRLNIVPDMSTINISSVSGEIAYSITGFSVPDVELNDLPDMLREPGTNVSLANPQLYLSIDNPVAGYGLHAASGLTLTAMKDNRPVNTCSLDQGAQIELGSDKGIAGPYNFCLSPSRPDPYYNDYPQSTWVGFGELSTLLSGNGLPDYIKVNFDNPRVLPGRVTDFVLDTDIDPVNGNYSLYAPLELTVGSTISYEDEDNGWGDDTLDKLTITTIKVTATVTNSLPVDITVSGTPLDAHGNPCKDPETGKTVSLKGLTIAAGTTSPVELTSDGTITGIDGIRYTATCKVTKAGQTLRPSETIVLKDIKVTVGGYYIDTL